MRGFLLAPIVFVAAVSATNLEQRSPFHALSSLTARDVVNPGDIPDKCKKSCDPIVNSVNSCLSVECLCTNKNAQSLRSCFNCLVKEDSSTFDSTTAQEALDSFVSGCQAAGVTINNVSLNSAPRLAATSGVLAAVFAGVVAYLL